MSGSKKAIVSEAWSHVDNARTEAETAIHALDELRRLIVLEMMNDEHGKFDVDAFDVFALGIQTQMEQAKADADKAVKVLMSA